VSWRNDTIERRRRFGDSQDLAAAESPEGGVVSVPGGSAIR
jgi:hypothetical protein